MKDELVEKVAEKLYEQRWYKGQVMWKQSTLQELFRNYAKGLIPIIKKAVAEEIKRELVKRSYPEDDGLEFYFEDDEWDAFWER